MTDTDTVLVAFASKHGATAEIAQAIGDALQATGLRVDVQPAHSVRSLAPYRAVILGSAVYAGRWRREALRLLRRPDLKGREVWLFSSGPVGEDPDDPAQAERWTKPAAVQTAAAAIGAHEVRVFGGRVAEDAGFIRKKMARTMPAELRDRRDWQEITAWAQVIAGALTGPAAVVYVP